MDIFDKLEAVFGSGQKVAIAIDLSSREVYGMWKTRGQIPSKHYRKIVAASDGKITLEELLPD